MNGGYTRQTQLETLEELMMTFLKERKCLYVECWAPAWYLLSVLTEPTELNHHAPGPWSLSNGL
jgi:hypothetical protein